MKRNVFYSDIDSYRLIYIKFLVILFLGTLVVVQFVTSGLNRIGISALLCFALLMSFVFWRALYNTYYEVRNKNIVGKIYSFEILSVDVRKIVRITKRSSYSTIGNSFKAICLEEMDGSKTYISPKDPEGFVSYILKINPRIKVKI